MIYSPRVVEPVEVEFVQLRGKELAVVAIDDHAHAIDASVFELLFEASPQAEAEMRARMNGNGAASEKAKPKRAKVARSSSKPVEKQEAPALDAYPDGLRDPRAVSLRETWDYLGTVKDATVREIQDALQTTNGAAFQALLALRGKNLVCGDESTPVRWRRA